MGVRQAVWTSNRRNVDRWDVGNRLVRLWHNIYRLRTGPNWLFGAKPPHKLHRDAKVPTVQSRRDELSFKDNGRAWDEQTRAWNISQLGPKPFILNQSVALCFGGGVAKESWPSLQRMSDVFLPVGSAGSPLGCDSDGCGSRDCSNSCSAFGSGFGSNLDSASGFGGSNLGSIFGSLFASALASNPGLLRLLL